jgi:alpha-tubulin suppressor-like RCC1 family protein
VPFQKVIAQFSAGASHCGLITKNGDTFTWGSNTHGETGHTEKGIGKVNFKS